MWWVRRNLLYSKHFKLYYVKYFISQVHAKPLILPCTSPAKKREKKPGRNKQIKSSIWNETNQQFYLEWFLKNTNIPRQISNWHPDPELSLTGHHKTQAQRFYLLMTVCEIRAECRDSIPGLQKRLYAYIHLYKTRWTLPQPRVPATLGTSNRELLLWVLRNTLRRWGNGEMTRNAPLPGRLFGKCKAREQLPHHHPPDTPRSETEAPENPAPRSRAHSL